jgi:tetratricopeptide (TPR) repeat protein
VSRSAARARVGAAAWQRAGDSRGPAVCALALFLVWAAVLAACGGSKQAPDPASPETRTADRPPIILISIDTLRSDRLPVYGYDGVQTPAIDALRRDSLLFERAYSHTPLTLPSHVSVLTGKLPESHGVRDNQGYKLAPGDGPFLPRDLARRGYAAGAAVSAAVLAGSTGLASGFDFYEDRVPDRPGVALGGVSRRGSDTLAAAEPWLRSVAGSSFFFFFHLFEPHLPHDPPEPFAARYSSAYDGEIAAADRVLGELVELLRGLDLYDNAAIVLMSDHGEGLGDHGEEEHGIFLYREALQVPLLVKLPGNQRAGESVASPVGLVDLHPTLRQLAGLDPAVNEVAVSLLHDGDRPKRTIYAETWYPRLHYGWSELTSLIRGRYHYIDAPRPELYDLQADPRERRNLVLRQPAIAAELRDGLAERDRQLTPPVAVDDETRRRLAALGYLGGGAGRTEGRGADPKEKIASLADLRRGFDHYRAGRFEQAVPAFRAALAESPGIVDGWEYLATSLRRLGRLDEAAEAFRQGLEASAEAPHLLRGLAALEMDRGRYGAAALALQRAGALAEPEPELVRRLGLGLARAGQFSDAVFVLRPLAERGDPAATKTLARVFSESGDQPAAAAELQRLLARTPDDAEAQETLGLVRLRQRRWPEARAASARAVELDPLRVEAWNNLGVALHSAGQRLAALDAWERAVSLEAERYDVLYNLGVSAAELGRVEQARRALSRFVESAPPDRYAADIRQARGLLARLSG